MQVQFCSFPDGSYHMSERRIRAVSNLCLCCLANGKARPLCVSRLYTLCAAVLNFLTLGWEIGQPSVKWQGLQYYGRGICIQKAPYRLCKAREKAR